MDVWVVSSVSTRDPLRSDDVVWFLALTGSLFHVALKAVLYYSCPTFPMNKELRTILNALCNPCLYIGGGMSCLAKI